MALFQRAMHVVLEVVPEGSDPMKYILITLVIAAAVFVIVGFRRALRTHSKFRRKEACLLPGDSTACGSTRCSGEGGLRSNSWKRAAEAE